MFFFENKKKFIYKKMTERNTLRETLKTNCPYAKANTLIFNAFYANQTGYINLVA